MSKKTLNKALWSEIKHDEWKKKINEDEYTNNSQLIKQICSKNLQAVSKKNKTYKPGNYIKPSATSPNISSKAREAYHRWKEQNPIKKNPCPEVNVQDLLLLLHYLNSQPNDKIGSYKDCLKHQNSDFELFWDSPTFILKLLRKCILKRDWTNMTQLLLILLNYDKKYLTIIKNMCQIMVKFNPLIKQCGLEDQFLTFLQTSNSEEQIVVV